MNTLLIKCVDESTNVNLPTLNEVVMYVDTDFPGIDSGTELLYNISLKIIDTVVCKKNCTFVVGGEEIKEHTFQIGNIASSGIKLKAYGNFELVFKNGLNSIESIGVSSGIDASKGIVINAPFFYYSFNASSLAKINPKFLNFNLKGGTSYHGLTEIEGICGQSENSLVNVDTTGMTKCLYARYIHFTGSAWIHKYNFEMGADIQYCSFDSIPVLYPIKLRNVDLSVKQVTSTNSSIINLLNAIYAGNVGFTIYNDLSVNTSDAVTQPLKDVAKTILPLMGVGKTFTVNGINVNTF